MVEMARKYLGLHPLSPHALLDPAMHRDLDQAALMHGKSWPDLLWQAAHAVASVLIQRWPQGKVLVLCGKGMNGADGFLCAELLRQQGREVELVSVYDSAELSPQANWAREQWQGKTIDLTQISWPSYVVVLDAILAAGLSRALEGRLLALVEQLVISALPVCAIDLPSGINGYTGQCLGPILQAVCTITFERYKPAHVLQPSAAYCGEVIVASLAMPEQAYHALGVKAWRNDPDLWAPVFPWPSIHSHKFTRGHVVVIGGEQLTGASRLSARAAQRIGAGLVSLYVPSAVWPIYAGAMESIMVGILAETIPDDPRITAYLCGPGAGLNAKTHSLVMQSLCSDRPVVLDADALTSFQAHPHELWEAMCSECVITPHEGEFLRLFSDIHASDKLTRARLAAQRSGAVVVLKGADTVIAAPDGRCIVNTVASPFLATGGSGDVLAGFITGLLAQGMPTFEAAAAAVWLHGRTALAHGPGLIAEDLIDGVVETLQLLWREQLV